MFFLQAYEHKVAPDSTVRYAGGQFYRVDDKAFAAELVAGGIAETEEQHDVRLAEEGKAAQLAEVNRLAAEVIAAGGDVPVPVDAAPDVKAEA